MRRLRDAGAEVVVGTCPDLGTIEPVAQPLRLLARRWSRDLAAAQTVAVVEAGGRTVSLGDLLGPEFYERPHEMFSSDRFHPSAAGYARAAAALLPSVCAALGLWVGEAEAAPDRRRGEGVGPRRRRRRARPCATPAPRSARPRSAARRAARAGRWAILRRRPREPVTDRGELAASRDAAPRSRPAPAGSTPAEADRPTRRGRDEAHTRRT